MYRGRTCDKALDVERDVPVPAVTVEPPPPPAPLAPPAPGAPLVACAGLTSLEVMASSCPWTCARRATLHLRDLDPGVADALEELADAPTWAVSPTRTSQPSASWSSTRRPTRSSCSRTRGARSPSGTRPSNCAPSSHPPPSARRITGEALPGSGGRLLPRLAADFGLSVHAHSCRHLPRRSPMVSSASGSSSATAKARPASRARPPAGYSAPPSRASQPSLPPSPRASSVNTLDGRRPVVRDVSAALVAPRRRRVRRSLPLAGRRPRARRRLAVPQPQRQLMIASFLRRLRLLPPRSRRARPSAGLARRAAPATGAALPRQRVARPPRTAPRSSSARRASRLGARRASSSARRAPSRAALPRRGALFAPRVLVGAAPLGGRLSAGGRRFGVPPRLRRAPGLLRRGRRERRDAVVLRLRDVVLEARRGGIGDWRTLWGCRARGCRRRWPSARASSVGLQRVGLRPRRRRRRRQHGVQRVGLRARRRRRARRGHAAGGDGGERRAARGERRLAALERVGGGPARRRDAVDERPARVPAAPLHDQAVPRVRRAHDRCSRLRAAWRPRAAP